MALGGERISVYQLILTEAGTLTLSSIAIRVACCIGAAKLMQGLLF